MFPDMTGFIDFAAYTILGLAVVNILIIFLPAPRRRLPAWFLLIYLAAGAGSIAYLLLR
jgi:hypothetical protein